jgi:hypothetical protein
MTVDCGHIDEWKKIAEQPHLLVLTCEQNDMRQSVSAQGGSLIVGRYSKLRLHASDSDVSQFHARFEWDQKARKWKVRDLNSSNGSKLNGKKMRADQRMALKTGDTVVLANSMTLGVEVRTWSPSSADYIMLGAPIRFGLKAPSLSSSRHPLSSLRCIKLTTQAARVCAL